MVNNMHLNEASGLFISIFSVALLLPVLFAIPLVIFGRSANWWLEATHTQKDKISHIIFNVILVGCTIRLLINYNNPESMLVSVAIIFLTSSIYFGGKQVREQGGFKRKTLQGQKNEAVEVLIKGAWRTKYHWGTILQIVTVIGCVILQIAD